MAIRRGAVPADRFTIIDNAWLRDRRISWKAKGLLAYIASHAPEHQLTMEQIVAESTDGRDAVRAAMNELEDAGYLRRIPLRDERGRAAGTDYALTSPPPAGDGKPGPGDDQAKDSISAGQDHNGFSGDGEAATKKTTPQKTKKTPSTTSRGTRLPSDWRPSAELLDWARQNAPGVGWSEHEKFVDYWRGIAGAKGVKLDWDATWRNWMRRASEQRGARPVSAPPAGQFLSSQEQNVRRQRLAKAKARACDYLMEQDPTLSVREAMALVDQVPEETLLNGVPTSMPVGYSGGSGSDVITVEEVRDHEDGDGQGIA